MQKVCVIGLGAVGLPIALLLANKGFKVIGCDVDLRLVSSLNGGKYVTYENGLQNLLKKALKLHSFTAQDKICVANIYIVAVHTMLKADNSADLSALYKVIISLQDVVKKQNLVIIESTCPIGTISQIRLNSLLAYCPERILPGNIINELINNDRVIGGTEESAKAAKEFYQSFVKGKIITTDARTAEAVKLAENAYRDVNIAFANELSMLADYHSLDSRKIISIANNHPRVNILSPSVGVGGRCLAIDPWYLNLPKITKIIPIAREVNLAKTEWVIKKIKKNITDHDIVACLGMTYKPDIQDIRNSPAYNIIKALGDKVIRVDPYVTDSERLDYALKVADVIVILVAHKIFFDIPKKQLFGKTILDFVGVFS